MNILIVDDIKEYQLSLEMSLKDEYGIVLAENLAVAKEKIQENIDLAVVDIRLSEQEPENRDGLVFLEWLKMNHPEIPVIMMSAYREFDLAVEALNLGAEYFLKKPINLVELKSLLKLLLSK